MPYTSGSILFTNFVPVFILFPFVCWNILYTSWPIFLSIVYFFSALELSSARNSSFGNAASVLCDFVELAPLGSSLTETLVELSYDAHVLLPGQASSIQARFSFFDASVGYTAEILQEFLERVGSYHWAILAPKGSGIFQEFINMLAVVLLRLRWVCFWLQDKETLQIGIIGFNFLGLEVGVLSCYPTHPYWQAGSTLEFLLHLLGYSSVWHRWRVGRAWARSSTTQTWTDTLHFAVLCLELAVLRESSLLCGAFLVCDCTKLCICKSLINQASSFQRAPYLPGPSMPLTDTEVPSLPPYPNIQKITKFRDFHNWRNEYRKRQAGIPVLIQPSRRLRGGTWASVAGVQMRRTAHLPLLTYEFEPGEAIAVATTLPHPFSVRPDLGEPIEEAIKFVAGPLEPIRAYRSQRIKYWTRRAHDLFPETMDIIMGLQDEGLRHYFLPLVRPDTPPAVGNVSHLALWREVIAASKSRDTSGNPSSMVSGCAVQLSRAMSGQLRGRCQLSCSIPESYRIVRGEYGSGSLRSWRSLSSTRTPSISA